MREMKGSGNLIIGDIPNEWSLYRAKYLFKNGIKSGPYGSALKGKTLPNGKFPIYNQANVINGSFDIRRHYISEENYNSMSTYQIHAGDVLFSMMGTVGKCCFVPENINAGIIDSHLFEATLNDKVIPSFFQYVYDKDNNPIVIEQFTYKMNGSIMDGLNGNLIKNISIPIPEQSEQAAIVSYLDRRCAAIDRTIKATQESIEKLKEYKRAIIARAVTKGLNPDAEMKNSGVDWIGEIPVTWDTINLKYTGSFDNGLTYAPADVKDNGLLVLRSSNIQDGTLDFKDCVYVEKVPKNLLVKKGDIIICSRNGSAKLVGKCALVDNELNATFGAFMMRYRTNLNHVFAYYLLQVALYSNRHLFSTTTINQLTRGIIVQIKVAIPTEQEQENIVVYLADKCKYIDNLIVKKEQLIAKFTEYRQSLIYAAVTGKIDCREEETA